ncbi:uncharacterized protein EDB91DRAFT_1256695 [Suillus paluster]|uniref:uncharacterized protein n=1 Tax=Suillus paluster TaxID=48578 RepID=UPI001B87B056|nr:uncharacterized protein EDB91DRAFT_1256695 [Suillus paluster]KAG1721042.1 hypothetical protein EDB91DRAFT_1256695 [Suillus paluster]
MSTIENFHEVEVVVDTYSLSTRFMRKGMGVLHVLRHHTSAFKQQDRQELGQGQEQEQGDSHQILEDSQGQEQEQEENSQTLEQAGVVVGDEHATDDALHDAQLHCVEFQEISAQGSEHDLNFLAYEKYSE